MLHTRKATLEGQGTHLTGFRVPALLVRHSVTGQDRSRSRVQDGRPWTAPCAEFLKDLQQWHELQCLASADDLDLKPPLKSWLA